MYKKTSHLLIKHKVNDHEDQELEENRVTQERQRNEHIPFQEPIDIKTEVSVSQNEYAEFQENGSELLEEIKIEEEEFPFETE